MEEFIKIPEGRIGVLIGTKGETRKKIEKATNTNMEIDSETGEVEIESKGSDGLLFYKAVNIVKAIARGFAPEKAMKLIDDDYVLDFVSLKDVVGKNKSTQIAKRGRVIGSEGKARSELEEKTKCFISVYGKTVGIIGKIGDVEHAKSAVEMLLEGATHSQTYGFLRRRENERGKFEL